MRHEERPNWFPWPPVILLTALTLGVVLETVEPTPWAASPMSDLLFAFGWLLAAAALALDFATMRTLWTARTTILPNRRADNLVTSGPFSFSRNPIYLANAMLIIAVGLILGSLWFIVLWPPAAFLTRKLAIEREEKHLEARFGKRFRDYQKHVRRWF